MDSTLLRLILLAAGILFLAGLYWWESNRRRRGPPQARPREAPQLGDTSVAGDTDEASDWAPVSEEPENLDSELAHLAEAVQEEGAQPPFAVPLEEPDEAPPGPLEDQQELFGFSAREESPVDLPGMILQINVVTRGGPFEGPAILAAAQETGLQAGEMHIFHRYTTDGRRQPLFNMASMVEPGSFPLAKPGRGAASGGMEDFTTPGLTLFAQLPGPSDGMSIFSDMLFTAQRLAALLGGELQDETHSVLSKQTIEHIRGQILEHRRLVQLARSRR